MYLLLDLSAAFDTIDHSILSHTLHSHFNITGTALELINSYMQQRQYTVSIHNISSSPQPLNYGVPQGSCLGPLIFTLYLKPLSDLISTFPINYHLLVTLNSGLTLT